MATVSFLSSQWFTAESEHHTIHVKAAEGCRDEPELRAQYRTRKSITAPETAEHFTSTFSSQSAESQAQSSSRLVIRIQSLIASNVTCLKSFIQSSARVTAWLKPRIVIAKLWCAYCGRKSPLGVKMGLISFSLLLFCYYFSSPGIYVNCNPRAAFAWEVKRK